MTTAVQVVNLQDLFQLGVPQAAGLLRDSLRGPDVAVRELRLLCAQVVHDLPLDDVEDQPRLRDELEFA